MTLQHGPLVPHKPISVNHSPTLQERLGALHILRNTFWGSRSPNARLRNIRMASYSQLKSNKNILLCHIQNWQQVKLAICFSYSPISTNLTSVWFFWFVCLLILYLTTRQNLGGANEDGMHLGCPVPIHSHQHTIPYLTILYFPYHPLTSYNASQYHTSAYHTSLPILPMHLIPSALPWLGQPRWLISNQVQLPAP